MRVKCEWFEPHAKTPSRTEHLTAEETKLRMFVKLPSGYVQRVRKFEFDGSPVSRMRVWLGAPGKSSSFVLSWNPSDYEVK